MFPVSWFLNSIYASLLLLASPILLYRSLRYGKYRDGWSQKLLGLLPKREQQATAGASAGSSPTVWFHAVSVGEVLQLETIVPEFVRRHPDARIVVTTTTVTGMDIAQERFGNHTCCYLPLDFSWAVKNALSRVKPDMIVLVELELWPNFILHAAKRGITLAMINARMSDRSFGGYRRIKRLIGPVLRCFTNIGAQNEQYAERLRWLGAESVSVTGSIKFDRIHTNRQNPGTLALREAFGIEDSETVLIAGSTQHPEEEAMVTAWQQLRRETPGLRLIVVPRHKERFDEVARMIQSRDLPLLRRSELNVDSAAKGSNQSPVILLDTLGELGECWGLANVALVGGSFGDRGGQNMIEPAAYGAAVLFGPRTRNFRNVVDGLLREGAAVVVPALDQLSQAIGSLLRNPDRIARLGQSAQAFVLTQQGASERTLNLLSVLSPELLGLEDETDSVKRQAA